MAITSISTPNTFSPVYNPLNFILLSDNIGQPNFKYVFEIVVGGETITIKQSPRPDGYGYLDVHRIAENFVTYDFDPTITTFALNSNSWASVVVNIYEEYGTPAAQHFMSANTLNPFNAFLETNYQWSQWMTSYLTGDWIIGVPGTKQQFLTNSPRTLKIGLGQRAYLHYINAPELLNGKQPGNSATYAAINASGSVVSQANVSTSFHTSATANLFQRIPVGTYDVGNLIDLTDAVKYTVQLYSGESTPAKTSELFTFVIDPLCSKYETYRFHFLNQLGGFDAFNFKCKDTITTSISPTTYERVPGTFSNSGFIYKNTDRGVITSNLEYADKITVESDWVSDAEAAWLKELLTSPVVFWEDESGEFTPVTISLNSYETKKSNIAEKLHNVQIQFDLLKQNRQRF